jgi:hypothetical protein
VPESEPQRSDEQPHYESEPVYAAPVERPVQPREEPPATASEQEVQRRRSTIREPVAFSGESISPSSANPPPPTAPIVSSSGADEQTTPKRGWWGKRLLGDKS